MCPCLLRVYLWVVSCAVTPAPAGRDHPPVLVWVGVSPAAPSAAATPPMPAAARGSWRGRFPAGR
eukprot:9636769-Karenia_brevis.AAC.1